MNAKQLSKNIGSLVRLRPIAFRLDQTGRPQPTLDDKWRVEAVLAKPATVQLVNTRTGQNLELLSDNVMEWRSPDFLLLRCQTLLRPDRVDIEPIQRGSPLMPFMPAAEDAERGPVTVNVPPHMERRLNAIRFRIAKDAAARDPECGYKYPVTVSGSREQLARFFDEVISGGNIHSRDTSPEGQTGFIYCGPNAPDAMQALAAKHRLRVIRCGTPVRI